MTLTLHKQRDTFIIRYEPGDERAVLDELVRMVADPRVNFDWFDAAVMSHQLGGHLAKELKLAMKATP